MTKRLILIRHAKSSWDAPFDDHARKLNNRGRSSCAALGGWLRQMGYVPDEIHTSDAARTVETSERIVSALGASPAVLSHAQMYHGAPETLMAVLRQATGDTVALVAHNPGIAFFAEKIVATRPDHGRFFDYPTGATLVCDFAINTWADAAFASAHVVDFIVPRDLDRDRT